MYALHSEQEHCCLTAVIILPENKFTVWYIKLIYKPIYVYPLGVWKKKKKDILLLHYKILLKTQANFMYVDILLPTVLLQSQLTITIQ